jgi:hypothetical protein
VREGHDFSSKWQFWKRALCNIPDLGEIQRIIHRESNPMYMPSLRWVPMVLRSGFGTGTQTRHPKTLKCATLGGWPVKISREDCSWSRVGLYLRKAVACKTTCDQKEEGKWAWV